jgi:integrase/recombinase XerD
MGLNIITLKEQMGHSRIETTMMYLHIAQSDPAAGFAPMKKLY